MIEYTKLRERVPDNEIELRVQSIIVSGGNGYGIFLAYKTARVDAFRLDSVLGAENWQKRYYIDVKGNTVCAIDVWDFDKKMWITKEDVGEDNIQGCKGTYSDAFKRAGFAWGIGRELYELPVLFIPLQEQEFKVDNNGKTKQTNKLRVNEWKFKTVIKGDKAQYIITDNSGNVRFDKTQEILHHERPIYNLDGEAFGLLNTKINQCNTIQEIKDLYKKEIPETHEAGQLIKQSFTLAVEVLKAKNFQEYKKYEK